MGIGGTVWAQWVKKRACSSSPARRYDETPAGTEYRGPHPRYRKLGCTPATIGRAAIKQSDNQSGCTAALSRSLTGSASRHALGGVLGPLTRRATPSVSPFTAAHRSLTIDQLGSVCTQMRRGCLRPSAPRTPERPRMKIC